MLQVFIASVILLEIIQGGYVAEDEDCKKFDELYVHGIDILQEFNKCACQSK